ncbi:MAG: WD40 repeat domain-containing protein [Cyanobacteria bacterium P01_A01_bin.17]
MTTSMQGKMSGRSHDKKQRNQQQTAQGFATHWKGLLEDYVTALAWSVDGVLAAGAASGEVLLWVDGKSRLLRSAASEQAIGAIGFSANGQYLAAAGQQGLVFIWDLTMLDLTTLNLAPSQPTVPQPTTILENPHCWIDRLAWHPSQSWLAFGAGAQVKVWEISQEKVLSDGKALLREDRSFSASSVLDLAWHPNGKQLAAGGHTGIKVWSTDNWSAPPELVEVPGASLSVAWSADGQYLASGNLDRTLTVTSWGNPPPWLMQGFPGKVRQVDWAPDIGKPGTEDKIPAVAAACAEGITVWRRQGKNWQSKVLNKHKGTVEAIAFHPTQPLLASAAQDGRLCLWKKAAALRQTLRGVKDGFSAIAWHPQGRYLAAGGSQGELIVWAPSNRGTGFQKN